MTTEARALDDVIDDGWEEITKPYSVPALVAALLEDHEASEIPESRRRLAACELPRAEARVVGVQR
jgi:hypothetical protein